MFPDIASVSPPGNIIVEIKFVEAKMFSNRNFKIFFEAQTSYAWLHMLPNWKFSN